MKIDWIELALSAYRFIGNPGRVTPEEFERRLTICNDCNLLNREKHRCTQCGCFISAKARRVAFRCPIGKWSTEETVNTVK